MKYKIRTHSIKIFFADILWRIGHFLKILSEKLEKEYATMQEELTKLWDARIEFLMNELNEKKK